MEVDFLLSKWLKEVPPYAGAFVQLSLLNSLVEVLLNSSEILNRASGKIRNFQILVSVTQILILLFSYIIIDITSNPVWAMAVTNILYIMIFVPRIIINKPFIGITFGYYFRKVLCGIIIMSVLSLTISLIPIYFLDDGWLRLAIVSMVSTMSIILFSYLFVLTKGEKETISNFIKKKLSV